MSALQKVLYKHMQQKGILLTDGSEKDKKVRVLIAMRNYLIFSCIMWKNSQTYRKCDHFLCLTIFQNHSGKCKQLSNRIPRKYFDSFYQLMDYYCSVYLVKDRCQISLLIVSEIK